MASLYDNIRKGLEEAIAFERGDNETILATTTIDADTIARDIATIIENEKDMRVVLQNAEPTITEESAIDYLRSTGWLQRHDKALTEFLEYLWNVINPNEMEQYWSMFNAREEKSNGQND